MAILTFSWPNLAEFHSFLAQEFGGVPGDYHIIRTLASYELHTEIPLIQEMLDAYTKRMPRLIREREIKLDFEKNYQYVRGSILKRNIKRIWNE